MAAPQIGRGASAWCHRDLAFLIGGPYGLEPGLRREADVGLPGQGLS